MSIEALIVVVAIALWFATGWYLNQRLALLHKRLDSIDEYLEGLRDYLYEIDPQFDDERELRQQFDDSLDGE